MSNEVLAKSDDGRVVLYRFFDASGQLLYIGVTERPGRRWQEHMKSKPWWPGVHRQTSDWHDNRESAEAAEIAAIKSESPLHNIRHAVQEPRGLLLGEPWTCPICEWFTRDPIEQIEHMTRETTNRLVRKRSITSEQTDRMLRDLAGLQRTLVNASCAATRAQSTFVQLAGARQGVPAQEPMDETDVRKLLSDLDGILGDQRVRLADLPKLLRDRDPYWPVYQRLTGRRLGAVLRAHGIRTTKTGGIPRLDPSDFRKSR